jgi:hypothetical protein
MRTSLLGNWQHGAARAAAIAAFAALVGFAPVASQACVGDCNSDNEVTVNEILVMVNIALGTAQLSACTRGDGNGDQEITVDEIVSAVNNALGSCPVSEGHCGDGTTQTAQGEECDDGGICIGGSNAGTACTSDANCNGNGVCLGGVALGKSCASDSDCPESECVRCKTSGGDGCASNCTLETEIDYNLVPGIVDGLSVRPGTSGAVVNGDPLTIPLAITGQQKLIVGKSRNGLIPFVIPAASVQFPQIRVSNLACACVRGVPFQTCGGTIFEADGTTFSQSCTPGFPGEMACPSNKPCAYVHGPGNSASGNVSCGEGAVGLTGVNVSITQDGGGPGEPNGPRIVTLEGEGPVGSAQLVNSTAIGTQVGACTPTFCLDTDPPSARGNPQTLPFTTGRACSTVFNANDDTTFDIDCNNPGNQGVGTGCCTNGATANCANLLASPPVLTGFSAVGAFPAPDQPTVGDIAVTTQFVAQ